MNHWLLRSVVKCGRMKEEYSIGHHWNYIRRQMFVRSALPACATLALTPGAVSKELAPRKVRPSYFLLHPATENDVKAFHFITSTIKVVAGLIPLSPDILYVVILGWEASNSNTDEESDINSFAAFALVWMHSIYMANESLIKICSSVYGKQFPPLTSHYSIL
eukprot:747810-Hanusia_phi.AAC.8